MVRRQKTMKGPDIKVLINIDLKNLDLWTFLGRRGWGSERNVHGTFLVTKLICESSLTFYDRGLHSQEGSEKRMFQDCAYC